MEMCRCIPQYPVCTECRMLENNCLLVERGELCCGPITAAGCEARCPDLRVPCVGCRGPVADANAPSLQVHARGKGIRPPAHRRAPAHVRAPEVALMSTIVIEHLARVEGHGGITVELEGDTVANVRFDVFEGARLLEPLVRGKRYDEVAPILSRICSICSAAHTLTSLKATENAFGIRVSPQTELLRELMFRGESIESHALHLFLLAAAGLPELSERHRHGGGQAGRRAAGAAPEETGQPDPGDHRRARHSPGERGGGRVRQGAVGGPADRAAQRPDAGGGGCRRGDRPDRLAAGHRFLPFRYALRGAALAQPGQLLRAATR